MPHGANGISICTIQTVMSCGLRVRFSRVPIAGCTHLGEENKSRVAAKEQYSRTCLPLLCTIAGLAKNADKTSPWDLSR